MAKVSSENQLADLFTKTHGAARFKQLLKQMQGTQRHRRMAYYMGKGLHGKVLLKVKGECVKRGGVPFTGALERPLKAID